MAPKLIPATDLQAMKDGAIAKLGSGGCADVFLVLHEGTRCALKVGFMTALRRSLQREAEFLEELAGAGGSPLPVGICPEIPALLMTRVGDLDLFDYLEEKEDDLDYRGKLCLSLKVVERLQEVHRAGYVHCDLKIDNVTVTTNSKGGAEAVHLIDFGHARRVGGTHSLGREAAACRWYCKCLYTGGTITPKCDMPGMAHLIADIFLGLKDLPDKLLDTIKRCLKADHAVRPDIEELRSDLALALDQCCPDAERKGEQPLEQTPPCEATVQEEKEEEEEEEEETAVEVLLGRMSLSAKGDASH